MSESEHAKATWFSKLRAFWRETPLVGKVPIIALLVAALTGLANFLSAVSTFAFNLANLRNQTPTIVADYLRGDMPMKIEADDHHNVVSVETTLPITYFNRGNRAFVVESVSMYLVPQHSGNVCDDHALGTTMFIPILHPDSTALQSGPDTIPPGTPTTVVYHFDIAGSSTSGNQSLLGVICVSITAANINAERKTTVVPMVLFGVTTGYHMSFGRNPFFFPLPCTDMADGKPHKLF